jgi:hypothetical protein
MNSLCYLDEEIVVREVGNYKIATFFNCSLDEALKTTVKRHKS